MHCIETKRLNLRQWTQCDYEAFAMYYSDEKNAKYVGGKKDAEQAWRHMALQVGHWALKGFGYWAVDEKSTGQFVGSVGLWQSPSWPELELGYWLVKEHQGKGYALEGCQRSIEFACHELQARSLVSYIHPSNSPSIRLAERLGAKFDGTIELASFGPHCVYRYF
jgi:RimJ/RimL family protein N-acetyltransferase